jgi:hypothetical protein
MHIPPEEERKRERRERGWEESVTEREGGRESEM